MSQHVGFNFAAEEEVASLGSATANGARIRHQGVRRPDPRVDPRYSPPVRRTEVPHAGCAPPPWPKPLRLPVTGPPFGCNTPGRRPGRRLAAVRWWRSRALPGTGGRSWERAVPLPEASFPQDLGGGSRPPFTMGIRASPPAGMHGQCRIAWPAHRQQPAAMRAWPSTFLVLWAASLPGSRDPDCRLAAPVAGGAAVPGENPHLVFLAPLQAGDGPGGLGREGVARQVRPGQERLAGLGP